MDTPWLSHLALSSLGICLLGLGGLLLRLLLRRDPVLAYRLLRLGIAASLLMPAVQVALAGRLDLRSATLAGVTSRVFIAPPARPLAAGATRPERAEVSPAGAPQLDLVATSLPRAPAAPDPSFRAPAAIGAASPAGRLHFQEVLLGVYGVGLLLALLSRTAELLRLERFLRRRCAAVVNPALMAAWHRLAAGSPLRHRVRLRQSAALDSPACWGICRPTIVLPDVDAHGPPTAAFEWALLHELVHLERRDPRTALCQSLWTAVFWFHPIARWLSRELDRLRELSCDDLVVDRTGGRRSYALALLHYSPSTGAAAGSAELVPHRPMAAAPMLPWSSPWGSSSAPQLRRRIEMLLLNRNRPTPRRRLLCAGGAATVLVAIFAAQSIIAGTFPSADEVLMARCDPKKKARPPAAAPAPDQPFQAPRPSAPHRSGGADIGRARPDRLSPQQARQWLAERAAGERNLGPSVPTLEPAALQTTLDGDVRQALIHTLLHDDYGVVRMAAADALAAHVNDPKVREAFLNALRNGRDETVRATVLDALLKREPISSEMRDLLGDLCALDSAELLRITVTEDMLPYAAEPEARSLLLQSLLDDSNEMLQMDAAKALAPQVAEAEIQQTMIQALLKSRNEIARMVMIDALAPQVAESQDVRDLFLRLLSHDDNEVARMAIAEAFALHADQGEVRGAMLTALDRDIDTTAKMAFAEALAPYAAVSDVKQAFIASLHKIDNEVIRMTMVKALSGPAFRGWHRARSAPPAIYPQLTDAPGELLPAAGSSRY